MMWWGGDNGRWHRYQIGLVEGDIEKHIGFLTAIMREAYKLSVG